MDKASFEAQVRAVVAARSEDWPHDEVRAIPQFWYAEIAGTIGRIVVDVAWVRRKAVHDGLVELAALVTLAARHAERHFAEQTGRS